MALPVPSLTASRLSKSFGRLVLFRDLDLAVGPGEALAVTGPNGSGKSTLLMILAGLQNPDDGSVEITVDARPIPRDARPLQVGFAAPYVQLYDDYSPRENLAFLASVRRLEDAATRIAGLLARVGLGGREDDLLKTFSSGMKQRVRLAAALLHEPAVLLLDEPGSNLDDEGRTIVAEIVHDQLARGGSAILATNQESEARLCGKVVGLGGRGNEVGSRK